VIHLRPNAVPMLSIAALWFLFFGPTRWWAGMLGPEREVVVLGIGLGSSLIIGVAWPGATRTLLAAAAALIGFALSFMIVGSPIEAGDENQIPTIGLLAALFAFFAQLAGTAIRFGISRWRGVTA
jgi:hypothetical protein